jgi:glycosyltransferase involved in cell wall biosynthesis
MTSKPSLQVSGRRVCLLIGQLGLGGTEKQVALLASGLVRSGIDTSVLVLFAGGPHEETLRSAGVPVIHVRCPRLRHGVGPLPPNATALDRVVRGSRLAARTVYKLPVALIAVLRLLSWLRRERPAVLHAFLLHSYLIAAPAARLARIPVLVAGRRSLGERHRDRPFMLALIRLANRLTDLIIANAHAVAYDTQHVEGKSVRRIATVYNGLAEAAFEPVPAAPLAAAGPVVLCVANLIRYKGHHHLLDACALLRDRGVAGTLVLVGDGPERERLERQAATLSIDVRFLGHRTDIAELLARADVCVLPSLTEGLSNAVMEAMAAGKAIVATNVGGTGELLRDGRGVLVPPGDAEALARAISRVLRDPELSASLRTRSREWARSHLRADEMVQRHIELYTGLLEAECAA